MNNFMQTYFTGVFAIFAVAVAGIATGQDANPNRATSGNDDPTRGVKGENLMDVNTGGGVVYPLLYDSRPTSRFVPPTKQINQVSERERTRQIYLQIQGYGAFNDSAVRNKLNLTDDQRQKLRQLDREWARRMAKWDSQALQNSDPGNFSFDDYERDFQTNIASILMPEQIERWQVLVGRPFGIAPEPFARSAPTKTTTAKPVF